MSHFASRISLLLLVVYALALPTTLASTSDGEGSIDPNVPVLWLNLNKPGDIANDFAIDPVDPANIYVGTGDAYQPVIYTRDFGQTWVTTTVGLPTPSNAQSIAVDPISPNYIYAGLGEEIYRSDDSGATWHHKDSGVIADSWIGGLVVHPVTPTLVFAVSTGGIPYVYRSDDRGETWNSLPLITDPTNRTVTHILVDPHDPAKIYAAVEYEGVFVSIDAGLTWANSGIQADVLFVDPSSPDIVYRTLYGTLYRSQDGGNTWDPLDSPWGGRLHMDPTDGNVLYLTSQYREVTRSVDGGQNWTILDKRFGGGPAPTSSAFAIDPADTTRIYTYGRGIGYSGMYVGLYLDETVYLPIVSR